MTVDEIKKTTTMFNVLNRYGIKTRKNMCSCPFHGSDRHPSMQIFVDGFKCHTCGVHGDIFSFVQEYEHCDFKTAFRILGGTYRQMKPLERKIVKSQFQREKEEKERKEKAAADFRYHLARTISGLRIVIDMYEPMSDMWAYAQHQLPWLEYVWEEKFINEGEVDELNVYRKCRAVEQYIGIG